MKKSVYIVAISCVCCMLAGCRTSQNTSNVASNSNAAESLLTEDFKRNFHDITIGDTEFSLPGDFSELEALGFTAKDTQEVGTTPVSVSLEKENDSVKAYLVAGGKKNTVPVQEAKIVSLLASKDTSEALDLTFYGGITFASTEEEVGKVLDKIESYDDGALYGIKMGDYSFLSVSFHGGSIYDIMVANGEEYFKKQRSIATQV